MNSSNQIGVTFFIIKGISDLPELQIPIFLLVLVIYLFTVLGNTTILLLVCLDHRLHTPMYFFLCNLAVVDMTSATVTLHKVLSSFISGDKRISFLSCMTDMYIFISLVCNELLILTAMSYDRFVAICNPLHYPVVMNHRVCILLAIVCWELGFIESLPHVVIVSSFSCYKSREINHFFCDILPVVKLSCNDTSLLNLLIFIYGLFLSTCPLLFTTLPYIFIIRSILRIRSRTGRRKAFYTCSSHLIVVFLLYMTLVCQYVRPTSMDSLDGNKLLSLLNTAAVPILNPLIYSLKNKDVKSALSQRLKWIKIPT
ncbi:olfactory receptor 8D1-like [Rhinophrynus dorsalis]